MYASAATLLGQPGPQRGPLPHLQLGPLPGSLRGPHPAPQPGLQQGRRREYQCFGTTADLKTFRTVGGLQNFPDVRINRDRSTYNNQFEQSTCCHMHLLRKGRSACLLPTRHSVQLWRPPGVNNNSEECKSHSGHAQVHAQNVSTMAPPPWHATPDGQWHAKRIRPAPPTSKAALYYWRGTFRSWPFTTEGVPPSNRPNVLAHVASYIHTVVRQRDPLRQVS